MDPAARTAFAARMATDTELAGRIAAHRWLSRQIVAAFGPPPVADLTVPLRAALGLGSLPLRGRRPFRLPNAVLALGMAATLVVGVLIGSTTIGPPQTIVRVAANGEIAATGVLADELSKQPSGTAGPVSIGMTFKTDQGICRTFEISEELSGLGCRSGSSWSIPVLAHDRLGEPHGRDYRLAGSAMSPAVAAEVERRIIGDPLSPADEKKLLSHF